MAAKIIRFLELCKLHNAKQIIRDKLQKYIKNHQLSQMNGPTRPERAYD